MARRTFEHLHPNRCVWTRVAEHANPKRGEIAVAVAARLIRHADGVTLGMNQQRLFAGERGLDRPVQQPRRKCGLALIRHVFLAAEGPAV